VTGVRFPANTHIALYFLRPQHLNAQLTFIYSGQARSQGDASGRIAPTKNLNTPATDLQNVKHKYADQLAKGRITPCRIHVLPLLNSRGWKITYFQKRMYMSGDLCHVIQRIM
jgi:hypothetical protein